MTLNVAIVGLGNIGNIHAGVYRNNPACKIVAVCDVIRERADKAYGTVRGVIEPDQEELLHQYDRRLKDR